MITVEAHTMNLFCCNHIYMVFVSSGLGLNNNFLEQNSKYEEAQLLLSPLNVAFIVVGLDMCIQMSVLFATPIPHL